MYLVVKRDWEALSWETPDGKTVGNISAGKHEVEIIPNPFGHDAPFLALKGQKVGASIGYWLQWCEPKWQDFQVIIEATPEEWLKILEAIWTRLNLNTRQQIIRNSTGWTNVAQKEKLLDWENVPEETKQQMTALLSEHPDNFIMMD